MTASLHGNAADKNKYLINIHLIIYYSNFEYVSLIIINSNLFQYRNKKFEAKRV